MNTSAGANSGAEPLDILSMNPDELLKMFPEYIDALEGIRFHSFKASESMCRNVALILRRALKQMPLSHSEAYDVAVIIEQLELIATSETDIGESPTEAPYGVPFPSQPSKLETKQ